MNKSVIPVDLRGTILKKAAGSVVTAAIYTDYDGILAETPKAVEKAEKLGLTIHHFLDRGSSVKKGEEIVRFSGSPKQVVSAEDILIGIIAKSSGIATAAHKFVQAAGSRLKIVSGAWKKMPPEIKVLVRRSIQAGGADFRICQDPFVYLDKNYTEILGGIEASLQAVESLKTYVKVIQLKGRFDDIVDEALQAVAYGAGILHIDTGNRSDISNITAVLRERGEREKVKIAFGGGIKLEDMDELKQLDVDLLDIGRRIVDAPLLDMRMEVIDE